MKKIAIVIVNYNGADIQGECLESLKKQTIQNFDVIIVDNGSTDDSVFKAKEIYNESIIIETHTNNGVAKGNNIGIDYALKHNYEYVLLLNNDTVLHEQLVELLFLKSRGIYITVPKIYFHNKKDIIWFAGGNIDFNRGIVNHWGYLKKDKGQYNNDKEIKYAPTCCMLIPIYVFAKIGTMDENYFMYYDDTDFCMRLNINLDKIGILYVSQAVLWHKVSSTAGKKSSISVYYTNRNRFYFLEKFNQYFPKRAIIYTYITRIIRYLLSFSGKTNDKYIKNAYIDYKKNAMGYCTIKK